MNNYETYFRNNNKLLEYIDLKNNKILYLDFNKYKELFKLKAVLDNVPFKNNLNKLFNFNINKSFKKDIVNFNYWNKINVIIKDNQITNEIIEMYFSKVCLDNLPHNFNNSNYCNNCGRSIFDIEKIDKKNIGIFKKYYSIYNLSLIHI